MMTAVSGDSDKIEAMAAVMIDTFGPRAGAVAQAQVDAAEHTQPAVAETWRRIVTLIADRPPAE